MYYIYRTMPRLVNGQTIVVFGFLHPADFKVVHGMLRNERALTGYD